MPILLAIPCYNCASQIERVLSDLKNENLHENFHHIAIIDNRSKDGTTLAAKESIVKNHLTEKASVFLNSENYGLGGTHKVAVELAKKYKCDWIAILHGDHQASPHEILDLIKAKSEQPELKAVLGARFMPSSRLNGYSLLRILGNYALNFVYTVLTARKIYDMGSGLNLFHIDLFADCEYLKFDDGFTFNHHILLYAIRQRFPIKYIPISWDESDQISNAKAFRVGWKALKVLIFWRFKSLNQLSERRFDSYLTTPIEG